MTTWEGGLRVPMLVRWPNQIKAGKELNGIQSHEDVFTTLCAAAGAPDIRERIAKGDKLGTDVEPEDEDYPTDPEFHKKFGPRGVLHTYASHKCDKTEDPRFGKVGKQIIEDTGPLTRKRMETVDEEFIKESFKFIGFSRHQFEFTVLVA